MAKTRRHSRAAGNRRPAAAAGGDKRQKLIAALTRHLQGDPVFQITTVDGLHWIDPHSGSLVEATFDRERVALEWLMRHRPWRKYPLKHMQQLRFLRWRHHLATHIEADPHLRIFSARGTWLNPFTGTWEEDICIAASGRISSNMLNNMAKRLINYSEMVLAECLSMAELQHLLQTRRRDEANAPAPTRQDSEPMLSLSAAHPTIASWPDDVMDSDTGSHSNDGQPSYMLNDDLDSPDLDFLKDFEPGQTHPAPSAKPAPAAPPAAAPAAPVAPVAKPAARAMPSDDVSSGPFPTVDAVASEAPSSGTVRRVNPQASGRSFGPWKLLNKLADGGLGGIYRSTHNETGRSAALNVLLAEVSEDDHFASEFINQGRRTMELNHPELVHCLDIGKDQGRCYMALELMEAGDAAAAARQRTRCRIPWQECLPWFIAVCRALDDIRRNGYMHGNIRPATIYPLAAGGAKLGHPQLPCCHNHPANANRDNQAFWSPEEARHEQLDIRTDIYAVGLSLFTLIAGEVPYHDLDQAVMQQRIANDPPPDIRVQVADVSEALARIIKTCLAKSPENRFQEPAELLIALERAV